MRLKINNSAHCTTFSWWKSMIVLAMLKNGTLSTIVGDGVSGGIGPRIISVRFTKSIIGDTVLMFFSLFFLNSEKFNKIFFFLENSFFFLTWPFIFSSQGTSHKMRKRVAADSFGYQNAFQYWLRVTVFCYPYLFITET